MKGKWIKYEIGQLVLVRRHDLSSAKDKEIKKYSFCCMRVRMK